MAQANPGDPYVCPKGTEAQVEEAFQEFWDAVEVIRVLTTRPDTWEATFTVALEGMLTPGERLALPGVAQRVTCVGGDATMTRAAATDWEAKRYLAVDVSPYLRALEEAAGLEEQETIIALAELLCLLLLAAVRAADWKGRLVLYVTDNDNVRIWILHRHARNRMARHLLRLLRYLEIRFHFVTTAAFVRTYHNGLQYLLSPVKRSRWLSGR